MNDLERCPRCFKLPSVTLEDHGPNAIDYVLCCEQHGHMASGQSLESAVHNWNVYVKFIVLQEVA